MGIRLKRETPFVAQAGPELLDSNHLLALISKVLGLKAFVTIPDRLVLFYCSFVIVWAQFMYILIYNSHQNKTRGPTSHKPF